MPGLRYNNRGFSLIELSMVLTIIAVIAGSALSVAVSNNDAIKRKQTIMKMQAIQDALAAFALINDRLPNPSNITLSYNDTLSGIEWSYGNSGTSTPTMPTSGTAVILESWVITGGVPTKTLKLPDEFMLDGWGNRMDFIVPKTFTGYGGTGYDTPTTARKLEDSNMGIIRVLDGTGAVRVDNAAYVLVSHGANASGAWPKNGGSQMSASSDTSEIENSESGGSFDNIFTDKDETTTYDDIVLFKTKDQLVFDAGALVSDSSCNTAATVLSTDDVTISSKSYNAFCKDRPGDINCANYLITLAKKVNELCIR